MDKVDYIQISLFIRYYMKGTMSWMDFIRMSDFLDCHNKTDATPVIVGLSAVLMKKYLEALSPDQIKIGVHICMIHYLSMLQYIESLMNEETQRVLLETLLKGNCNA